MGTRQKLKKSRTPRKFSQSSLRGLTNEPINIFEPLPNEHDEEIALMARLQHKALEDDKARKKLFIMNLSQAKNITLQTAAVLKLVMMTSKFLFTLRKKAYITCSRIIWADGVEHTQIRN